MPGQERKVQSTTYDGLCDVVDRINERGVIQLNDYDDKAVVSGRSTVNPVFQNQHERQKIISPNMGLQSQILRPGQCLRGVSLIE